MKISVILTSYNHGKYIGQSIESILKQTYKDFELLIYDDCSDDDSMDVISSFTDERIKVIANPFRRESGIVEYMVKHFVKSEFVAIAHSDDYWEADKLEKQMAYLKSHEEAAAVFTHANVVDDKGKPYREKDGFYYDIFEAKNRDRFQWLRYFFYHGNCLCHPSVLIRTKAYEAYRLFPAGLRQLPDFYMWIRLCLNSEIHILEEKLTNFRIQPSEENTSGLRKDTSIRSSIEHSFILNQFLELNDCDEFLTVFPEAKAFADKRAFLPSYAFARVCLQEETPNYKKIYGLKLLYDLFHDAQKKAFLEKTYGFAISDFFALTGKFDIYGLYPFCHVNEGSLYLDYGTGYAEEHKICQPYEWWRESQKVTLCFRDLNWKKEDVKKIRFDPAESFFVKCKIHQFQVNGETKNLLPMNAADSGEEGEIFITTDPSYEYETDLDCVKEIAIFFELEQLSMPFVNEKLVEERRRGFEERQTLCADMQRLQEDLERKHWLFYQLKKRIRRETNDKKL